MPRATGSVGPGAGEPPPCNSANGGSFRRRFRRDLKRFTTARVLGFSADGSGVPAVADGARVVSARNYRKSKAVQVLTCGDDVHRVMRWERQAGVDEVCCNAPGYAGVTAAGDLMRR